MASDTMPHYVASYFARQNDATERAVQAVRQLGRQQFGLGQQQALVVLGFALTEAEVALAFAGDWLVDWAFVVPGAGRYERPLWVAWRAAHLPSDMVGWLANCTFELAARG